MRIPLPPQLVEQAHAYVDGGATPAEPSNAATVVLMRPGDGQPEIYLLRRQTSMAFAGGMCVFPGGRVDERDFDASIAWAGPTPAEWAEHLGVEESLARALVCAAVRETFEESGVLLAGASPDTVVADTSGDDWEADRQALEAHELAFTTFLVQRGLVLRTDLLGTWSGWLTPIFEPRRYRTWFFVAEMPMGQVTRDISTEADHVTWLPALDAVAAVERQEILMLPPTYLTCLEIGQLASPEDVVKEAQGRIVEMFMPEVVSDGEEFVLSRPAVYESLMKTRDL